MTRKLTNIGAVLRTRPLNGSTSKKRSTSQVVRSAWQHIATREHIRFAFMALLAMVGWTLFAVQASNMVNPERLLRHVIVLVAAYGYMGLLIGLVGLSIALLAIEAKGMWNAAHVNEERLDLVEFTHPYLPQKRQIMVALLLGLSLPFFIWGVAAQAAALNEALESETTYTYEEQRAWQIANDTGDKSITGTVYSNTGGTTPLTGIKVSVSLNGGPVSGTGTVDNGGMYTINGLTITGGTIVGLYISGAAAGGGTVNKAMTVSFGTGDSITGGNMTGMTLIRNNLIVKFGSGRNVSSPVTNTTLRIAKTRNYADMTAIYNNVSDVINVTTGRRLHVWTGSTLSLNNRLSGSYIHVNGNLLANTSRVHAVIHLSQSGGTVQGGTNTIYAGSNFSLRGGTFVSTSSGMIVGPQSTSFVSTFIRTAGTFTHNNGTVTFKPSNTGTATFSVGTATFNHLTFTSNTESTAARTTTITGTFTVEGDLNVSKDSTSFVRTYSASVSAPATITVQGNFYMNSANARAVNFNSQYLTINMTGNNPVFAAPLAAFNARLNLLGTGTAQLSQSGSALSGTGWTVIGQDTVLTGPTRVYSLTINNGATLDVSPDSGSNIYNIRILKDLYAQGTYTARTNTTTIAPPSAISQIISTKGTTAFYDLTLIARDSAATISQLSGSFIVNNDMNVTKPSGTNSRTWRNSNFTSTAYPTTITVYGNFTMSNDSVTSGGSHIFGNRFTTINMAGANKAFTVTRGAMNADVDLNGTGTATLSATGTTSTGTISIDQNTVLGAHGKIHSLTINNGFTLDASPNGGATVYDLKIAKFFTNNGGTYTPRTNTTTFNPSSGLIQTISAPGITFYNLTLESQDTTSITTTLSGIFTVSNDVTVTKTVAGSSGNRTWASSAAYPTTISVGGNWNMSVPVSGTITFGNKFTTINMTGANKTFAVSAGAMNADVNLNGTGTATLSATGSTTTGTIVLNQNAVLGAHNRVQSLSINAGNTLDASPDGGTTSYDIAIVRNFINDGTYTARSNTTYFTPPTTVSQVIDGSGTTFYNVAFIHVDANAGTTRWSGSYVIGNDLNIHKSVGSNTRTITASQTYPLNVTVQGALTMTNTIGAGSTTARTVFGNRFANITMTGTNPSVSISGGAFESNLNVNGTGTATLSATGSTTTGTIVLNQNTVLGGNTTVAALTIAAGKTLDASPDSGSTVYDLKLKHDFYNYGTFTARTSLVTFEYINVYAKILMNGSPLYNAMLRSADTAAGAFTTPMLDSMTVANDLHVVTFPGSVNRRRTWTFPTGSVLAVGGNFRMLEAGSLVTLGGNTGATLLFYGSNPQTFNEMSGTLEMKVVIGKPSNSVTLLSGAILSLNKQDIILTGGTLDLNGNRLVVQGNAVIGTGATLRLNGTETVTVTGRRFAHKDATIWYDQAGGTVTLPNVPYQNLIIGSTGSTVFNLPTGQLNLSGSLTISGGTLTVNSAQRINLSGSWLKTSAANAGFSAGLGTVLLTGGDQTMSGSTTFYNLTKSVTSPRTLTFAATTTQRVTNTLTLSGIAGNRLSLRSSQTGTQWKINPTGARIVQYADVRDSNNIDVTAISCSGVCTNSLNNTNWSFEAATVISVTGRVYGNTGASVPLSGVSVALLTNGNSVAIASATTDAGGQFTMNDISATGGTILTFYVAGSTHKAVTVTTGSGDAINGANMTGVVLVKDNVIVKFGSGFNVSSPITSSILRIATAGNGVADVSRMYYTSSNNIHVSAGKRLWVWTGTTLNLGGTFSGSYLHINGNISQGANKMTVIRLLSQSGGTFTGGSETILLSGVTGIQGNLSLKGGTFISTSSGLVLGNNTTGDKTVVIENNFNHNNGTVMTNMGATARYVHVMASNGWSLNNFTMSGGTVNAASGSITVNNNYAFNRGAIGNGEINALGALTAYAELGVSYGKINILGANQTINWKITNLPGMVINAANTTVNLPSTGTVNFYTGITLINGTFNANGAYVSMSNNPVAPKGPRITVSGGTFIASSDTFYMDTYGAVPLEISITGGTFNHNNGVFYLRPFSTTTSSMNVSGNPVFYTIYDNDTGFINIPAGQRLVVQNLLAIGSSGGFSGGTIEARGRVDINQSNNYSKSAFVMTGTGTQYYESLNGSFTNQNWTIAKDGGSVIVSGSTLSLSNTNQQLAITGGTLNLNGNGLTVAGNFVQGTGTTLRLHGNETISVTGTRFAHKGATTWYDKAGGTINLPHAPYQNVIIGSTGSTVFHLPSGQLNLSGSLTISGGTLATTNGQTLRFSGSWLKTSAANAAFTAGTGTVLMTGRDQSMSGSTTFYNLTKNVSAPSTLTFAATTTQTVTNALTLNGIAGNRLSLRSSQTGTQWKIDPSGTRSVSYVDVKDSNNTNATAIDCSTGCANSNNNTNWAFPTTGTVKGTLWSDSDGDGTQDAGETTGISDVSIALSGTTNTGMTLNRTTTTASTGQFFFSGTLVSNSAGYTVTVNSNAAPTGYLRTRFNSSGSNVLGVGDLIDIRFGYVAVNTMSGAVFVDANSNGIKDASDTAFSGTTLTLSGTSGTGASVNLTTTSNASGTYAFRNLPTFNGTVIVAATAPAGYTTTTTNSRSISFGTGGQLKQEQFIYALTVTSTSDTPPTTTTSDDTSERVAGGGVRTLPPQVVMIQPADDSAAELGGPALPTPEEIRIPRIPATASAIRVTPEAVAKQTEAISKRISVRIAGGIEYAAQPISVIASLTETIWSRLQNGGAAMRDTAQEIAGYFGTAGAEVTQSVASTLGAGARATQDGSRVVVAVLGRARDTAIATAIGTLSATEQLRSGIANAITGSRIDTDAIATLATSANAVLPDAITSLVSSTTRVLVRSSSLTFAQVERATTVTATLAGTVGTRTSLTAIALLSTVQQSAEDTVSTIVASASNAGMNVALRAINGQTATSARAIALTQYSANAIAAATTRAGAIAQSRLDATSYQIARIVVGTQQLASDIGTTAARGIAIVTERFAPESAPRGVAVTLPPAQNYRTSIRKENGKLLIASLSLSIFDSIGKPYDNTPVVLFSTPKVAVTNESGIATFHNVETGKHQIEIHVSGGGVQKSDFIIEPPSDLTLEDQKQLDVALPLIQLMVEQPQTRSATSASIPVYGWAIILLLTLSNIGWAAMIWSRKNTEQQTLMAPPQMPTDSTTQPVNPPHTPSHDLDSPTQSDL